MECNKEMLKRFIDIVSIDSPSGNEEKVAEYLMEQYRSIGVVLEKDEEGNLFGRIEGIGPSVLFSSHMDTVQPACGKKAIVHEDGVITSDGTTVLGADDVSGLVEIFELVKWVKESKAEHRPIELLFTTGEETFGDGANAFDYSKLQSKEAYVLDLSGPIGKAAYAAPTIISLKAKIKGKAAHSGFNPEDGIHSIVIASKAIARLPMGHVGENTRANIGCISGGSGINIVPAETIVEGEVRSLCHEEALTLACEYQRVFQEEADLGGANLEWTYNVDIQSYETSKESHVVQKYIQAVQKLGKEVILEKTFGGSDHNVFAQHGIEGIVIANSMNQVHSVHEYCNIHEMEEVVEILKELVH